MGKHLEINLEDGVGVGEQIGNGHDMGAESFKPQTIGVEDLHLKDDIGVAKPNFQEDITPLEAVRISLLFSTSIAMGFANAKLSWREFIKTRGLERHFDFADFS